jgi:hypothetical protein
MLVHWRIETSTNASIISPAITQVFELRQTSFPSTGTKLLLLQPKQRVGERSKEEVVLLVFYAASVAYSPTSRSTSHRTYFIIGQDNVARRIFLPQMKSGTHNRSMAAQIAAISP